MLSFDRIYSIMQDREVVWGRGDKTKKASKKREGWDLSKGTELVFFFWEWGADYFFLRQRIKIGSGGTGVNLVYVGQKRIR